ncbi:MAG: LemA family protein [Lachnospiraceae bacterium]|nr:LemA family protein [Lachnospiraceae bacterium]
MSFEMILVIAVLLVIAIYVIKKRNEFADLKEDMEDASSNASIAKARREEAYAKIMGIASKFHEKEVSALAELGGQVKYENLLALENQFPDLKTDSHFINARLTVETEERNLQSARIIYNQNITAYNKAINKFPANIVAKMFSYEKKDHIDQENLAENTKLNKKEFNINDY